MLALMRLPALIFSVLNCASLAFSFEPKLVLTARENGTENQDTFSCSGSIHGYLVLPQKAVGKHQLEGVWILPNGQVLEHSHIPLDFQAPGRSTAYLWLAFPERTPVSLSLNPREEETRLSYNGVWSLHVLWDQQPLLKTTFNVQCS